ncbi:MAG TPA: hypothetical protein VMV32_12365 [Ignavibacteriaceae bacterium]|nr:hypothetical protein [Ignavibacteriaceae bacterium]
MVGAEEARRIDEEIKIRQDLLDSQSSAVRSRIISLKAYPDEIVKRIQQVNGVIVEFQERI